MNYKTFSTPALLSCALTLLCSYEEPKEKKISKKEKDIKTFDVIIVPGVPYQDPAVKFVLKSRILWAKYLFDTQKTKNIIFSGSSVYTPYVEADIMKIYSDSLGIPSANVYRETQAEHSTENIYYSVMMAKKLGFTKIAIATDRYQAMFLNMYLKKNFPEISVIPIDYRKIDMFGDNWPEIDETPAYVENFVSLLERENKATRFKGSMGKNIKFVQNDSTYENTQTPLQSGLVRMVKPVMSASPFLSVIYNRATK